MLGIRFMKAAPTTYVIHFKNGRAKREGLGLSFYYFAPTSEIAAVPAGTADLPFVFNGATADFQAVTVQGQLTYRVAEPRKLAGLLDFSVDAAGAYRSDDPGKLDQRLVNEAQILANAFVQRHALKDILRRADHLAGEVLSGLRASSAAAMLGIEPLGFAVLSLKPSPEMARALEAEAREGLQREADQAIYTRRNYAVEQERRIKESELNTEIAVEVKKREIRETQMNAEIAVEEKKRQVRETQMGAEIAVEERRKALVELQVKNERQQADSRAYALEAVLKPVQAVDWKTLLVLGKGGIDPRAMIALAFQELAGNADKIGSLNITPDLLEALTKK